MNAAFVMHLIASVCLSYVCLSVCPICAQKALS